MRSFIFITFLLSTVCSAFADEVKEADLAGSWYPASKAALSSMLEGYLNSADPGKVDGKVFAIISPHAGYQFSGPVAAYGFKAVKNKDIKTVIVIGFSHRRTFDGISVYDRGSFRTPLGEIKIDAELANQIIACDPRIWFFPEAFRDENSVEMQLPFIQIALKGIPEIVPIGFGTQDFNDAVILSDALAKVLKDRDDCLIVASTDMSHYHPYDEANSIDKRAISILDQMNPAPARRGWVKAKELYDEVSFRLCELCGIMPVTATLLAADKLGYGKVKVLKYANSGDTSGNKGSVVGYLSAAIYRENNQKPVTSNQKPENRSQRTGNEGESRMLNDMQRKGLLQIARESIISFVKDGKRKQFTESDPVLNKEMGAFVTLHESGNLRGCIGNMVGRGPLYQTVADMAIEAATGDPRFPTLSAQEIDKIDIEISVLSPMKKVSSHEEVKIPGHGVMVKKGLRNGVYLPQVATETGWNKEEFLTSLCGHKAGLAPDAWKDPATDIYVFTAEIFGEKVK